MLIKNTLRVLINNLNITFKTMLYRVITMVIGFAVMYLCFHGVIERVLAHPAVQGFIGDIKTYWHNFISGHMDTSVDFKASFQLIVEVVKDRFADYVWLMILAGVGAYIFLVISSICSYTVSAILHAKMSTCSRLGFFEALFSNLKKSILFEALYSLLKILALGASLIVGYLFLVFTFEFLSILAVAVAIVIIVCLYSVFLSMTALFRPLTVSGAKVGSLFKNRLKNKYFWLVWASYIFSMIIFIYLNVSVFVFTLGAGVIIMLPLTQIYFTALQQVLCFHLEGKKYFIDFDNIEVPNIIKAEVKDADFINDIDI